MPRKGQLKKNAKPNSVRQRKFNSSAVQKKNRAARNRARRRALKSGRVKKGDGKVLDHVNPFVKGGARDGATRVRSKSSSVAQGGRLRRRRRRR